ncbi:MAG: tannase/feruloyl esterase family alpha/beta hydrolase [Stellaceae bacterium]
MLQPNRITLYYTVGNQAGYYGLGSEAAGLHQALHQTQDFYRLFLVPGMSHCSGGPGSSTFDALTSLEQWVEHGIGLCCKLSAVARETVARGRAHAHVASSRSPTSWTASLSALGPRPKARSTRRASPTMSRVRLKIAA